MKTAYKTRMKHPLVMKWCRVSLWWGLGPIKSLKGTGLLAHETELQPRIWLRTPCSSPSPHCLSVWSQGTKSIQNGNYFPLPIWKTFEDFTGYCSEPYLSHSPGNVLLFQTLWFPRYWVNRNFSRLAMTTLPDLAWCLKTNWCQLPPVLFYMLLPLKQKLGMICSLVRLGDLLVQYYCSLGIWRGPSYIGESSWQNGQSTHSGIREQLRAMALCICVCKA